MDKIDGAFLDNLSAAAIGFSVVAAMKHGAEGITPGE